MDPHFNYQEIKTNKINRLHRTVISDSSNAMH